MNAPSIAVRTRKEYITPVDASAMQLVEAEFVQLLRGAVAAGKFGQFGVLVSLQDGHIKTWQSHAVETCKP